MGPRNRQHVAGSAVTVNYHAPVRGGQRMKCQKVRGTLALMSLSAKCDKAHPHKPWKSGTQLLTSEEAEYPLVFCQRAARAIVEDPHFVRVSQMLLSVGRPPPSEGDPLRRDLPCCPRVTRAFGYAEEGAHLANKIVPTTLLFCSD